jgi:hypothetical protein
LDKTILIAHDKSLDQLIRATYLVYNS